MNAIIQTILAFIFRTRSGSFIEVVKTARPFPSVRLITLGPLTERYGVARDIDTAVKYAELLLFDQLQNEPDLFDGEWLLKFTPGDYYDNLEELTREYQKHDYIKKHGIDIEAAIADYRKGHRSTTDWLESVFDAHSFSLKTEGDAVYWRR